ncbi:MAG: ABC transporter permease [Candidatus Eisenbacteria bacterium]
MTEVRLLLTLLRIHLTNLSRDRAALILTFLVPMSFFTVFALVFGQRGNVATARVRVAVVDEAHTAVSARLVDALGRERGLRVTTRVARSAVDTTHVVLDRARAMTLVKEGEVPVAIVIPAGIDTSLMRFDGGGVALELLTDPSDPVAPQIVNGLIQKAVMTAMPDLFARRGVDEFERYAGGLTPRQRTAVDGWMSTISSSGDTAAADSTRSAGGGLVKLATTPVLGRREDTSMVSFYTAGIAVMFLLFGASGAAGTLLDEVDSGTLDRVLSSRVGMTGLLAGKWLSIMLVGVSQLVVMFVYAMLAFRLDLLSHLPGFAVMTMITAATTAAFGLFLATLCRTRQQLGGISTLVILILSALGGSMFPRFLMSDAMQRLGLLTFNAWALDGFIKVFWRSEPLTHLAPQVGVLAAFLVAFLTLARLAARRWERA